MMKYSASDEVEKEISPETLQAMTNAMADEIDEFVPEEFLGTNKRKEHWPDGLWPVYSALVYERRLWIFPLEYSDGERVLIYKWESEVVPGPTPSNN